MSLGQTHWSRCRNNLIIRWLSHSRNSGPGHGERHGTMTVRPSGQGCAVIRRHEDAPIAMSRERCQEWADDVPVDLLQRFHLLGRLAFMRSLVGSFDVDTNQIVIR